MAETIKYCSKFNKGLCHSPINPQPLSNFHYHNKSSDKRRPECKFCRCKVKILAPEGMKFCSNKDCKIENPQSLRNFRKNSASKDGKYCRCKHCTSNKMPTPEGMKYCSNPKCTQQNPQPIDNFGEAKHHKDRKTSHCRMCLTRKSKNYDDNHRDVIKIRRDKHAEESKQYKKEYYSRLDIRKKVNAQVLDRKKKDINFRLACNLRRRLGSAIKGKSKIGSAVRDLGCTIEELKIYLENQFQPGMTWENWGRKTGDWSIDHKIALSTVDLSNPDEFLMVSNYTNLRPLWNKDQVPTYHKEQKQRKILNEK